MSISYDIISIGALSRNPMWNETQAKRAAHATVTLVRTKETTILVDPSLPDEVMRQRLDERSGLAPDQIDMVFLTSFRPVHRRGLGLFPRAEWYMNETEIDAVGRHLEEIIARNEGDAEVAALARDEQSLLRRVRPAPERLNLQVHLYPSFGVTPGSAGLLLAYPSRTVIVAGDAVLTRGHAEAGRVYEHAADVEQARESLGDIMELADEIVPGHDNAFSVSGR